MKVPKANKLPSGSWNIRLRLGGEEISVTEPTEQEAIKKARLIKAEYLAGKREAKAAESSLTLSAAIDLYCADRSNKMSPATVRKYKNIKANHWKSLMQKRMDEITARQWQTAVNNMLARYATKTVKVSLGMTKSVVLACGAKFPKVKVEKSSAEKAKEIDKCKFLEPEQILAFVSTVEKKYAETPYAIPLLLALSSLRIGEIDGLDWSNVTENAVKIRRVRIMDENNEDEGMKDNEKGYAVATGMTNFDAAFVDAAMALEKIGDISPKTKGSYGYYIIRYESDEAEGPVALDAVKETLSSSLLTTKQNDAYEATKAQWVDEAGIKVDLNALKD